MVYFARKKDLKRCQSCEFMKKYEKYGLICTNFKDESHYIQIILRAGECAHEAGLYKHISKICRANIHDGCKKEFCECECHT